MSPPPWRIVIASSARRQFSERLPEAVAAACYEFLAGPLATNPHRVGAPLRKPFEGQWRARRGTYRIRYRIDETTRTNYVLDVEHRPDAYRH
jgi:mRNA-degrading endonuclease RelE of RelBE toxin-antitoxin system